MEVLYINEQIKDNNGVIISSGKFGPFESRAELDYFTAFKNSVIVAVLMVSIIIIVSSTGAYIITRKKNNERIFLVFFKIFFRIC